MSQTLQHEARAEDFFATWGINELLQYGMKAAAEAGVQVGHTKLTKTIRHAHRVGGTRWAINAIGVLVESKSWQGFELFVNGYADPTGAHAARNVDLELGR